MGGPKTWLKSKLRGIGDHNKTSGKTGSSPNADSTDHGGASSRILKKTQSLKNPRTNPIDKKPGRRLMEKMIIGESILHALAKRLLQYPIICPGKLRRKTDYC